MVVVNNPAMLCHTYQGHEPVSLTNQIARGKQAKGSTFDDFN